MNRETEARSGHRLPTLLQQQQQQQTAGWRNKRQYAEQTGLVADVNDDVARTEI